MKKIVDAKLHGITVTDANLNYHGSITLDPEHCALVGILPLEFVDIWNKNSGARISTYVIFGEAGSKCCVLNGAAARTCQPGDQIIICSSNYIDPNQLDGTRSHILTFDAQNNVAERLTYVVDMNAEGTYDFKIEQKAHTQPA
ncbi:aspartate 1-decarboxylase [Polycladidibacter stylochi]|uniref:aspartate 1-decarboxylase n=1 Tax=Polycladidibacter stylochi TaxID=1807766 RepID=UPI00082FDDF7|nr:aspartate 1-decarboxylase [Pseudovibrio stylochi]